MRNKKPYSRSIAQFAIDNAHPVEYAAQWGSTVGAGPLFYNCSSQSRYCGRTIANPEFTPDQWERLRLACVTLADAKDTEEVDRPKLRTLSRFCALMAGRSKSTAWNLSSEV